MLENYPKIMKIKALLILIITIPIHVFGLSGVIDSTNNHWGNGGNVLSPVTIDSDLTINEGTILTIEPGTQIIINGLIRITGKGGIINAIGSLGELIEISPANDTNSHNITISDSLFVNFKFCKFSDLYINMRDSKGDIQMSNSLLLSSNVTITRAYAKIVNNTFHTRGGDYGIYVSSSWEYQEIINNIIDDMRGGMFCFYHYTYTRYNLVTADNSDPLVSPILPYCDSFDGASHPDSSYFQGNLLGSPMFVDPENEDFHLLPKSPGIDAGELSFDYSLEPEGGGNRINMGMYGNTREATTNLISSKFPMALNPSIHLEVFPNPTVGDVTINYSVSKTAKSSKVSLFSINGHLIKTFPVTVGSFTNFKLNNEDLNLSPGIYVLKLETDILNTNKKFIVVR